MITQIKMRRRIDMSFVGLNTIQFWLKRYGMKLHRLYMDGDSVFIDVYWVRHA